MLGVWFAVLGGLFVSGVALEWVLVSEYRRMGESGSVRLCEGFVLNAVYHLGEPNEMVGVCDANQLVGVSSLFSLMAS
jgi:hypothetical protein